jgi:hypothetical protein
MLQWAFWTSYEPAICIYIISPHYLGESNLRDDAANVVEILLQSIEKAAQFAKVSSERFDGWSDRGWRMFRRRSRRSIRKGDLGSTTRRARSFIVAVVVGLAFQWDFDDGCRLADKFFVIVRAAVEPGRSSFASLVVRVATDAPASRDGTEPVGSFFPNAWGPETKLVGVFASVALRKSN